MDNPEIDRDVPGFDCDTLVPVERAGDGIAIFAMTLEREGNDENQGRGDLRAAR
jgi:hypothetical protein